MLSVVLEEFITIVKPGSQGSVKIPNPFYTYHRKDIGSDTVRVPDANSALVGTIDQRTLSTSDLFSVSSYNGFSNNMESIHDLVHVYVGGDMADISRAAFDPVFWLHHCNVDRLMAMYQSFSPGHIPCSRISIAYICVAPSWNRRFVYSSVSFQASECERVDVR